MVLERERKARTTLLMALPEDHLAKFHKMSDAKEMWDAIKSRFGGNDESKKMSPLQMAIKKFLRIISSAQNDLEQLDEFDLEEMDLKWQVDMNLMRLMKFYKKTGRRLQILMAKEPIGVDKTKIECFKCHKQGTIAKRMQIKWKSRKAEGRTGNTDIKQIQLEETLEK
ncbi:hypothetical protein Tco_0807831 [Tanacetum coccineum]